MKQKPKRRPYAPPRVETRPIFERMALMCGQKPESRACRISRAGTMT